MCFYTTATLQVATILVTMAPNFWAGDLIYKKVSLNQKNWLPIGDRSNFNLEGCTAMLKNIPALSQKSCSLNFAFQA